MQSKYLTFTPTSAFFSFWLILFTLIFIGGYFVNFLGYAIAPPLLLGFVILGFISIAWWLVRQRVLFILDKPELLGMIIVFVGTLVYLIAPSWPTLFPPSYSGDPALHYAFIDSVYSTGRIIASDPGGPSLIAATFAHWLGIPILRVMHPTAALWLALIASAIYGMTCVLLPTHRFSKILALVAPLYLFVSAGSFSGLILGAQYFYSQSAGHLFIVAVFFFLGELIETRHSFWEAMVIASFIGVSVTYQLWLVVPGVALVWALWRSWCVDRIAFGRMIRVGLIIGTILALFWIATRLTSNGFIPDLSRLTLDGGAVMGPTFNAFGGWLVVFAILGIPIAWRLPRTHLALVFLASTMILSLFIFLSHLILGGGMYWFSKSLFLWVLPMAILSALTIDWILGHVLIRKYFAHLSPTFSSIASSMVIVVVIGLGFPPSSFIPLDESEVQVALWAKANLDTLHINYISSKSLFAQWLGVALWGEKYPPDLWLDLARLGPRTFEEWRDTPGWGEYLFISNQQQHPLTPDVRIIFQRGQSMIVQKSNLSERITKPPLYQGTVLSLAEYAISKSTVHPGEAISVTMQIQTHRLPARHAIWRLLLRDTQNEPATEASIEPFDAQFPMQRWPDNIVLTQTLRLQMPPDLQPGVYNLLLGLNYLANGEQLAFHTTDGASTDVIHLGKIKIALPPVTPTELASLTRIDATLGEQIRLLGYQLHKNSPLCPDASFPISLYWQNQAEKLPDYTVFVQLLDRQDKLIAQQDMRPRNGTLPTSFWDKNEIVPDGYTLKIPADIAPGDYRLIVGMYAFPSLQRLGIVDASGKPVGNYIELQNAIQITANDQCPKK